MFNLLFHQKIKFKIKKSHKMLFNKLEMMKQNVDTLKNVVML